MYTHSNYWGDADVSHSQTIGGIQPNYWGEYIPHPHPPCFGTPDALARPMYILAGRYLQYLQWILAGF